MSNTDFARYWAVEGGINGENGPLIELRYDRGDEQAQANLGLLDTLVDELKLLEIDEVLSSPKLISQLWGMPSWLLGQQFRWERQGYNDELLSHLIEIRRGVDAELFRIFNSRFRPDWTASDI